MKNGNLTWNKVGLWTLLTLFLSAIVGIYLIRQKVFLFPPLTPYTVYFYLAIVILPPLIVFVLCINNHPTGKRTMLTLLPILTLLTICAYITLLGPAFNKNIRQCQLDDRTGLVSHLKCVCESETSGLTIQNPCAAQRLWFFPLIRLTKEY